MTTLPVKAIEFDEVLVGERAAWMALHEELERVDGSLQVCIITR